MIEELSMDKERQLKIYFYTRNTVLSMVTAKFNFTV
jgi:hypothetical protein